MIQWASILVSGAGIIGIAFVSGGYYGGVQGDDRGRGGLTQGDIEYLRDPSLATGANERNKRMNIRKRVRNSIIDFAILFEHLQAEDRALVLLTGEGRSPVLHPVMDEEPSPPEFEWEFIGLKYVLPIISTGGIRSMHAFCYLSLFEALEIDFSEGDQGRAEEIVRALVTESLEDVYGKYEMAKRVHVDIRIEDEETDLSDAMERFDAGEPVHAREVEALTHARMISFEQMAEWIQEENNAD